MARAINLDEYYTASEAAAVIKAKSGDREVPVAYMRKLAQYGILKTVKVGHSNLYLKSDVEAYKVEARGAKLERAAKARKGMAAKKAAQQATA